MKYFIGGWEVSLAVKLEHDRQQECNRQAEYEDAQRREELRLLCQIEENTRSKR